MMIETIEKKSPAYWYTQYKGITNKYIDLKKQSLR
jgi:tRNA splicing ligase